MTWWGAQNPQQKLHYLLFTSFTGWSLSSFCSQHLCKKGVLPVSLAGKLSLQGLNFLSEAPSDCGCCWVPLRMKKVLQGLTSCCWLAVSQGVKWWLLFFCRRHQNTKMMVRFIDLMHHLRLHDTLQSHAGHTVSIEIKSELPCWGGEKCCH